LTRPTACGTVIGVKRVFGWSLLLVGAFFTTAAVIDIVTGSDKKTGLDVLVGLVVFFGGLGYGGFRLIRAGTAGADRVLPPVAREAAALRLAHTSGGSIGAAQLAAHAAMSFQEAEATLASLVGQGACDTVVTDGGAVLYRFPDLALTEGERRRALDVTK
jgi:hypothetical protein